MSEFICNLCPRQCSARRGETGEGFCGMPADPVLARAALHFDEEPCISGSRGSGAVFFSGCTLKCVYCQNEQISRGCFGKVLTVDELRAAFESLVEEEAHNINIVTGTHFTHSILAALEKPIGVPVVWNTSGYERVETLQMLEGKVQVYLPKMSRSYFLIKASFSSRYTFASLELLSSFSVIYS